MSNNRRPAPCEGPDQGVFDEDEIEEEIWKSAGDVWRATKKRAVSGAFSDLFIECGGQTHKVHKLVMAASPFFAKACDGSFKEASEGIIRLPEDNPDAVKAMIDYLYHGCYGKDLPLPPEQRSSKRQRLSPCDINSEEEEQPNATGRDYNNASIDISESSDGGSVNSSQDENQDGSGTENEESESETGSRDSIDQLMACTTNRSSTAALPKQDEAINAAESVEESTEPALACFDLPLDAMVYALAEKYDLCGMKRAALRSFYHTVESTPSHVLSGPFREAAIIAYDSTPEADHCLRSVVAQAIIDFEYASDYPDIQNLLVTVPALGQDVNAGLFKLTNELRSNVKHLEEQLAIYLPRSSPSSSGTSRRSKIHYVG